MKNHNKNHEYAVHTVQQLRNYRVTKERQKNPFTGNKLKSIAFKVQGKQRIPTQKLKKIKTKALNLYKVFWASKPRW